VPILQLEKACFSFLDSYIKVLDTR